MRDRETAEIGLRASMTGHMVFSTLHTNDAISSATRLIDIGIEGYLAAASLRGILAQRLVRKICEKCREEATPDDQQYAWLNALVGKERAHALTFFQGRGCSRCNRTGFYGRTGVFELLELDEELANTLRSGDSEAFGREARRQRGFRSLVLNALDLAVQGDTALSEVLALSGQVDDLKIGDVDPLLPDLLAMNARGHGASNTASH